MKKLLILNVILELNRPSLSSANLREREQPHEDIIGAPALSANRTPDSRLEWSFTPPLPSRQGLSAARSHTSLIGSDDPAKAVFPPSGLISASRAVTCQRRSLGAAPGGGGPRRTGSPRSERSPGSAGRLGAVSAVYCTT